MFSRFFIDRPIFSTVLSILLVLAGIITVKTLPIAQYPNISPPTVEVSASYPGADATTVAEAIGEPIEEAVNGVEGMLYMSSNSDNNGSYSLQITFDNGTDLDDASVKVQNLVSQASPQLPSSVTQQGVSVNARSSNILLFVALESDDPERYDALYLTNYAQLHIVNELARIDGVGGANAFGAGDYSMRIWMNPDKMRIRDVDPADVIAAIEAQNMEVSAGSVGAQPSSTPSEFQFTLSSKGRLVTPEEFGNIIIKVDKNNNILRLKDIAQVDLGSESYGNVSRVSGQPAGLIGIYQRSDANAIAVANAVEKKLEDLERYLPDGVHCRVLMNTTDFVHESIDEVMVTFVETTLIVMLVILLFLQNWRAVIIPMLTIPVSLIATFAVMKIMGFSLNTLTLFGLVLAIAIVVDDAIVVVEDCSRIVDEGKMSPADAARKAMVELQGPVIGEVLVLLSVFIPTAFISGITGELYKQFALTIAVSTAFSGFNALTFTPAMCALFLRPKKPTKFFLYSWFNAGFAKTLNLYLNAIGKLLKRPAVAIGIYAALCVGAFWGFSRWPTSYMPEEDMGYFLASVQLPTGASLDRTDKVVARASDILQSMPEIADVIEMSGFSFMAGGAGSNLGTMFVVLKPWSERKGKSHTVEAITKRFDEECAGIQEAVIFALNPPAIPGLGLTSGLAMQLLDINGHGAAQMSTVLDDIKREALNYPEIASITSLYEGEVPQYRLKMNRDKIQSMGLSMADVYSALSSFVGGRYVNDFVEFNKVYQVNIAADDWARANVGDIMRLCVRGNTGEMVPFGSFATIEPIMGSASINRYNMYESASLTATPAHGSSSSQAKNAMEEIVAKATGDTYGYAWTGEAYQETQTSTTVSTVLIFALIMTVLVLAAQYESWTDPLAVVIAMPTAILGTIIGCLFMDQSINIYTQIGIVLLLGLSAKNAILIVEYAIDYHKAGMPIREAARQGGIVRFRPILMTALAFVFGVMPMLFATGAGAQSRISLGAAVVFGMAVNAIIGTLFVPNFWELFQKFQEKYLSKVFAGSKHSASQSAPAEKTDGNGV